MVILNRDATKPLLALTLVLLTGLALSCDARPIIKIHSKPAAPVNLPKFNNIVATPNYNITTPVNTAFPVMIAPNVVKIQAIPVPSEPQQTVSTKKTPLSPPAKQWITPLVDPTVEAEVSRVEKEIMARTYPTESINSRITRLEKFIFGQTKESSSQPERLSALSRVVPAKIQANAEEDFTDPSNLQERVSTQAHSENDVASETTAPSIDTELMEKLEAIELKIFNRTFANESVDSRISRMEKIQFNSTASDMSDNDRLDRVASVMRAHASSTQEKISQDFAGIPGVGATQAVSGLTGLPQNLTQGRPIKANNPNGPRRVQYGGSGIVTNVLSTMGSPANSGYSGGYMQSIPMMGTGGFSSRPGITFGTGMNSGSVAPQIMMMIFSALTQSPHP